MSTKLSITKNQSTVAYENNEKKLESVYSKRIRVGKRRTYFFDVKATRGNDYYLTITESRKRFNDNGYDRHKIFLYKEDFNKFCKALTESVDYVKTDLMPDFDFDAFNHEYSDGEDNERMNAGATDNEEVDKMNVSVIDSEEKHPVTSSIPVSTLSSDGEEVDKW